MIASVTFEKTTYNVIPYKFEAGTPNVAGVIGLGAAIDYVASIGLKNIAAHKDVLLKYGTEQLKNIPDLKLIGEAKNKTSILSFVHPVIHAHDMGTLVDEEHVLRQEAETKGLDGTQEQRLQAIEVELDECWDMLNQRRALRHAGLDPGDASVRDPKTVEGYQQ